MPQKKTRPIIVQKKPDIDVETKKRIRKKYELIENIKKIQLQYTNTTYNIPYVFKLNDIRAKSVDKIKLLTSTTTIDHPPLMSLGYIYSIRYIEHELNGNLSKIEKEIINNINDFVVDFDNNTNIVNTFNKYISDKQIHITDNSFFKLWEILSTFDVASKNNMTSIHIGDMNGGFVHAYLVYRNKLHSSQSKQDTIHICAHNDSKINSKFLNKYSNKINVHKYAKHNNTSYITCGDIENMVNKNKLAHKVNFVTANISSDYTHATILSEILCAITALCNGGSFICEFKDLYTNVDIQLLYILNSLFDEVYITKPFTSNITDAEHYIVCVKFTNDDKLVNYYVNMLNELLIDISKNKSTICTYDAIDTNIKRTIRHVNITIGNKRIYVLSKALRMINDKILYNNQYDHMRDEQEQRAKQWAELFINNKSTKDALQKIVNTNIEIENKSL
jgi:23S rRNA U2552 (ribose-2'-O)-methylase RlmE/FtsJ